MVKLQGLVGRFKDPTRVAFLFLEGDVLTQFRNIYAIAGELLRLVGCLSSMRPVLQSMFHRILLFPPPNYRLEALRAVNEYFQSPMRVLDICGPTIQDTRVNENRARRDYDTDLLKLLVYLFMCNECADSWKSSYLLSRDLTVVKKEEC